MKNAIALLILTATIGLCQQARAQYVLTAPATVQFWPAPFNFGQHFTVTWSAPDGVVRQRDTIWLIGSDGTILGRCFTFGAKTGRCVFTAQGFAGTMAVKYFRSGQLGNSIDPNPVQTVYVQCVSAW